MRSARTAGVLLSIEALPGRFGIGDVGCSARDFIDFLVDAKQSWWYVPSISPTSTLNRPSYPVAIDAGNPYLISLERLSSESDLGGYNTAFTPDFPEESVDGARVKYWFDLVFKDVFRNFDEKRPQNEAFAEYCERHREWLDDVAHFQALRRYYRGQPWWKWPQEVAQRIPQALSESQKYLRHEITREKFLQFVFDRQWQELTSHAHDSGIGLIGTLPTTVVSDSAEVWAHPEHFEVDVALLRNAQGKSSDSGDDQNEPRTVQPRWDIHRANGFAWWVGRLHLALERFDVIRIDDVFVQKRGQGTTMPSAAPLTQAIVGDEPADFRGALSASCDDLLALVEGRGVAISEGLNASRESIDEVWAGQAGVALAAMPDILHCLGDGIAHETSDAPAASHLRLAPSALNKESAQRLARLTSQHRRTPS